MAYLMQQLAEYTGSCCVKRLLEKNKDKTNEELAHSLGVSTRTVCYWRTRLRKGTCTCRELSICERPELSAR